MGAKKRRSEDSSKGSGIIYYIFFCSTYSMPIVSVNDWELAMQLIGFSVNMPSGALAPAY